MDAKTLKRFRERSGDEVRRRTDGRRTYGTLALEHELQVNSRPTPPEKVNTWLPVVHLAIPNLKRSLRGTFRGVSAPKL